MDDKGIIGEVMTETYFEAPRKKGEEKVYAINVLQMLEKNDTKKIDEWVAKGLVSKERVSELKKTLQEAKMLKWESADALGLTLAQRATLWDLVKNGKDAEAEALAKSYVFLKETSFVPVKVKVKPDEVVNEAKHFREIGTIYEGKNVVFTEKERKILRGDVEEGPIPIKIVEKEHKEAAVKSAKLGKKDLADATEKAKKIAKAMEEGDYKTVEQLLPELKKGEKWFGGARGIWVDKRIAILQALYNELVEDEKDKIKVDGVFGEQTLNAIKDMQRWAGLQGKSVDGYYDGETRSALIEWAKTLKKDEKKDKLPMTKEEQPQEEKVVDYKQMFFDKLVAAGINKKDAMEIANAAEEKDYNKMRELIEKNTRVVKTEVRQTGHREGPLVRKTVLDEEATRKKLLALKEAIKTLDTESEHRYTALVVINEMLGIEENIEFPRRIGTGKKKEEEKRNTAIFTTEQKEEIKEILKPVIKSDEKAAETKKKDEDEEDYKKMQEGKKKWGNKEEKEKKNEEEEDEEVVDR
ncbi:MAG: peptidoglycan-binding domain-containing protein [Candidatus Micrarchaeia archaeon]